MRAASGYQRFLGDLLMWGSGMEGLVGNSLKGCCAAMAAAGHLAGISRRPTVGVKSLFSIPQEGQADELQAGVELSLTVLPQPPVLL